MFLAPCFGSNFKLVRFFPNNILETLKDAQKSSMYYTTIYVEMLIVATYNNINYLLVHISKYLFIIQAQCRTYLARKRFKKLVDQRGVSQKVDDRMIDKRAK